MKKIISVLTACIIAATAVCIGTGLSAVAESAESAESVATTTVDVKYYQSAARRSLETINEFRTSEDEAWYWDETDSEKIYCTDLEELTWDYNLEKAAMQRAAELVISFSHYRPNGSWFYSADTDLFGANRTTYGENITRMAYNEPSDDEIDDILEYFVEELKETYDDYEGQGHRRNMLSSDYTAVAVSCIYYDGYIYFVQLFASPVRNTTYEDANDSLTSVTIELSEEYTTEDTEENGDSDCEHEFIEYEHGQWVSEQLSCTEMRYTRTCSICGYVETKIETGDLHTYEYISNGADNHTAYCTVCGYQGGTAIHSFTDDGICEFCGAEKTVAGTDSASDSTSDEDADASDSDSDDTATSTATVTSTDIPDTGAVENTTGALACVLGALGIVAAGAVMLLVKARKKAASEA